MTYAEFHDKLTPEQLELSFYLDKVLLDISGVSRKMRYKVPFYDYKSWICYFNPRPHNKAELCFLNGKVLIKTHPTLELRGRKMVAGVLLDAGNDINTPQILEIFHTAMLLQEA